MKPDEHKLSIIIPVYNSEEFLDKCLQSILIQEHILVCVILIDDGSTDNSSIICHSFQEKYPATVTYYRQDNKGVSSARNQGILLAKTEFVMFVDSDDSIELSLIIALLKQMNSCDFSFAGFTQISKGERKNEYKPECFCGEIGVFASKIEKWLNPPFLLSPWGKIFKTEIIKEHKLVFPINISYGEDACFVFQYLMKVKTVSCIDNVGYLYTIDNNNSLTNSFKTNMIDGDFLLADQLKILLEKNSVDNIEAIYNRRLVASISNYTKRLIMSKLKYKQKKELFYRKSEQFSFKNVYLNNYALSLFDRIIQIIIKHKSFFWLINLYRLYIRI